MRLFSRVLLPLLLFIYIAIETYLKLQHTSLCGEVGCKLAGELLKFDAIYLNYLGLVGVFSLIILGIISLKKPLAQNLFFLGLYTAIAFESTIISYQFMANSEPCIFCLGIISSLLMIALLNNPKNFVFVVFGVVAIFAGLSTLAITKNKTFMTTNNTYLINSKTCPHCQKVKSYMKEHNISYIPISTKEASARSFLKFANITSIPVLVVKTKEATTLIVGDKRIINYYKKPKEVVSTDSHTSNNTSTSSLNLNNDFLHQDDEEGCTITVTAIPDCEKTDALPFGLPQ